jgi:hypothetical protein
MKRSEYANLTQNLLELTPGSKKAAFEITGNISKTLA